MVGLFCGFVLFLHVYGSWTVILHALLMDFGFQAGGRVLARFAGPRYPAPHICVTMRLDYLEKYPVVGLFGGFVFFLFVCGS